MRDFAFVAVSVVFFIVAIVYVRFCDPLVVRRWVVWMGSRAAFRDGMVGSRCWPALYHGAIFPFPSVGGRQRL